MATVARFHRRALPVVPFGWLVWITVGRMLFPAPGQSGPWITEFGLIAASVVVLLPLLLITCGLILSRPSVKESGSVSAVDSVLLSTLYVSMLLFAACVSSVDDSQVWPSLATRLIGDDFAQTSNLIEVWSSLAVLGVAVTGTISAGIEWLAERRNARNPALAPAP